MMTTPRSAFIIAKTRLDLDDLRKVNQATCEEISKAVRTYAQCFATLIEAQKEVDG